MKIALFLLAVAVTLCLKTTGIFAADSCVGRCGENDGTTGCQCNSVCSDFADCCTDYETICLSCKDRCGEAYVASKPCQCNADCPSFGNCCTDYTTACNGTIIPTSTGTSAGATDADVIALTEELYTLDQSLLVGGYITYDTEPPGPLFTAIDPAAFTGPTISAFLTLRGNYDPYTTVAEDNTPEEVAEKEAFLDVIMATDVMIRTEAFLTEYSMISKPLRDVIDEIFFTFYPRDGTTLGSSGFEHSFMGEIDAGEVKGFHNWISFYQEEQEGSLSYTTYLNDEVIATDLGLYMMGFDWDGYTKPISSMWIGSTPELELALYVVCFYHKPNSLCDVSMNGVAYQIQTYTQAYNGGTYVGSAYPDITS